MKTITTAILSSAFFSITAIAQNHPILGNFVAAKNDNDVSLNWEIIEGSTCNGIRIYRSANKSEYQQIGDIPGICGSITEPLKYYFTDENPIKNVFNHYKLDLGGLGFSQVVSAEVITIESGYQVRPNPAADYTRIYFDNSNRSQFSLLLYDVTGKMVLSQKSQSDFFDLDLSSLNSGIYSFSISLPENPYYTGGKLMIQR